MNEIAQKLREALELIEYELQASYNNAKPVCCGHGYGECCGNPEPVWDAADQKIMDVLGPVQRALSDVVSQVDAQTAEIARLREALWVVTEHNALQFGESHNTVIVGRAALAQEGS
jgi:hypothetical protein